MLFVITTVPMKKSLAIHHFVKCEALVRRAPLNMLHYIKVYFRESSIHGLSYLVNDDRNFAEKLFWALVLIISSICCGALILKIGVKVQEDATVTYASDTPISFSDVRLILIKFFEYKLRALVFNSQISFLAVTFCPDLLTHIEGFDYNRIVRQLMANEISIENVTQTEYTRVS